jgi:hypothetical protein
MQALLVLLIQNCGIAYELILKILVSQQLGFLSMGKFIKRFARIGRSDD